MPPPSSLAIALGKPSTLSLGSSPYTPSDRRAQRQARSDSLWAATATTNGFPCRIQDIPTYTHDIIKGGLRPHELVWRNAYDWLQREGYKLRPRYDPRWVPSWVVSTGLNWYYCEDGRASRAENADTLDALRVSDGRLVMLKRVRKSDHPHEAELVRFFSQQPRASDYRNHVVPLYDVLQWPGDDDIVLLVLPYLVPLRNVRFETMRETLDCIRQLLDGLQFLHQHCITYRCRIVDSIMVNPIQLFTDSPHPLHTSRSYDFQRISKQHSLTVYPSRFYYTNFSQARRVPSSACAARPTPDTVCFDWDMGCDPWPPEVVRSKRLDPFRADIHSLGQMINILFQNPGGPNAFMRFLVDDMMARDPAKRPSIEDLVARFEERYIYQLQTKSLDTRVAPLREEPYLEKVYEDERFARMAQKMMGPVSRSSASC